MNVCGYHSISFLNLMSFLVSFDVCCVSTYVLTNLALKHYKELILISQGVGGPQCFEHELLFNFLSTLFLSSDC